MIVKTGIKWIVLMCFIFPHLVRAQTAENSVFKFNDLTLFNNPDKSWSVVSDVVINPSIPGSFKKVPGEGIILAEVRKESYLSTQTSFGDVEVEFDFLLAKGTSAAILLEGRYKLNLSDSWAELTSSVNTMGAIAPLQAQQSAGFSGDAPWMNVAKSPGLWQHAKMRFRAPQFTNGKKTTAALFEEVYINGCLVQQNVELQGPTVGSIATDEMNAGPVVFFGNNGTFALKNVQVRKLPPLTAMRQAGRRSTRVVNPITVIPQGGNYLLRGFLMFGNKKKTHAISVGNPNGVNFSYDMKQGALLQVWNGLFADVTEMWNERGEPQLAKPLGSVVLLSENPALAVLQGANAVWPDSIAFDDFKNMGYTLDKQRNPSFEYETGGYHVWDKIFPGNESRNLVREISVTNTPANLYSRIANAGVISPLGKGWYVIDDKSYYIQIDEKFKASIRTTPKGAELIVPITTNKLSYSLIW